MQSGFRDCLSMYARCKGVAQNIPDVLCASRDVQWAILSCWTRWTFGLIQWSSMSTVVSLASVTPHYRRM